MTRNNTNPAAPKPEKIKRDTNALASASAQQQAQAAAQSQPPAASSTAGEQELPTPASGGIGSDEPTAAMRDADHEAERGSGQRTRIPFGAAQSKLSYPPRIGFYRYWFRNDPGRIDRAKAAGYAHVTDAVTDEPVTRHGGADERGNAIDMFLMEQPIHWHEEDVALGQKPVDEMDSAIRRGAVGREKRDGDQNVGVQADGHKISIGSSNRR